MHASDSWSRAQPLFSPYWASTYWNPLPIFNINLWERPHNYINLWQRVHNLCVGDGGQCQVYVGLQATAVCMHLLWLCPKFWVLYSFLCSCSNNAPPRVGVLYSCYIAVYAPCSNYAPPRVWCQTVNTAMPFDLSFYFLLPLYLFRSCWKASIIIMICYS